MMSVRMKHSNYQNQDHPCQKNKKAAYPSLISIFISKTPSISNHHEASVSRLVAGNMAAKWEALGKWLNPQLKLTRNIKELVCFDKVNDLTGK